MVGEFSSDRVKKFAGHLVKTVCSHLGIENISELQIRLILDNSSDLKTIYGILRDHIPIKHYGKYGELDKVTQKDLNLQLALLEICGRSSEDKRKLVNATIQKNDNFIEKSQAINKFEKLIFDFVNNLGTIGSELNAFFDKVNNLFVIQKNELRRLIPEDSEYALAIENLAEIYRKYLKSSTQVSSQMPRAHVVLR